MSKYFAIPFENVPANPTYTVWYATWSKDRPQLEPGMSPPMVVGVTTDDRLPAGAVFIGGGKDPPPPPPPPPPATFSQAEYQAAFQEWARLGRDEDE